MGKKAAAGHPLPLLLRKGPVPGCGQSLLLRPRELLDGPLPPGGLAPRGAGLCVHQGKRASPPGILCSFALAVGGKTPLRIIGDAGVKGIVSAAENIDIPGRLSPLLSKNKWILPRFPSE